MKRRTVIYLSGPISGIDRYWEAFEEAEEDLRSRGYVVYNPCRLPDGMTNRQYMAVDIPALLASDVVLQLPGWARSDGACIESALAKYAQIPIYTSRGTLVTEVKVLCQQN